MPSRLAIARIQGSVFNKISETHEITMVVQSDSFTVPTYLFFKRDERLGGNDVNVAGQAGNGPQQLSTM